MGNLNKKMLKIYESRCYPNSEGDISGHLNLLHNLVLKKNAKVIVELGVRDGNSTVAFLSALLQTGGRLYSCDINELCPVYIDNPNKTDKKLIKLFLKSNIWNFYIGSSIEYFEQIVMEKRYPMNIDIFFTDTDHAYSTTKFELFNYSKLLSPSGIILIHDMDPWNLYPEQTRAVEEFLNENKEWNIAVQKGNFGLCTLYRDESHLEGVMCDLDTGLDNFLRAKRFKVGSRGYLIYLDFLIQRRISPLVVLRENRLRIKEKCLLLMNYYRKVYFNKYFNYRKK